MNRLREGNDEEGHAVAALDQCAAALVGAGADRGPLGLRVGRHQRLTLEHDDFAQTIQAALNVVLGEVLLQLFDTAGDKTGVVMGIFN